MTYADLYNQVARLAQSLRRGRSRPGDRVCAYMPNLIQTPAAMLATTSIGAVWASCGAELGPQAVLDRFGQIEPKVLFTVDGYFYRNRIFNTLGNAAKVAKEIPSLQRVVVASYVAERPDCRQLPNAVAYDEFLSLEETVRDPIRTAPIRSSCLRDVLLRNDRQAKVHGARLWCSSESS